MIEVNEQNFWLHETYLQYVTLFRCGAKNQLNNVKGTENVDLDIVKQLTFKQFLKEQRESDIEEFRGSLSEVEKRVISILLHPSIKNSPARVRDVLAGDSNAIAALRRLQNNFDAVDADGNGATLNQRGVDLARRFGLADVNTGDMTQQAKQLAQLDSAGNVNPKTADLT